MTAKHFRLYSILRDGLRHFGGVTGVGEQFGRDWLIRLGENGVTPDLVFINRERLAHYYVGKVPQGPDLYGYGETLAACEDDLRQMVYNWLLLHIARRKPMPTLSSL